MSVSARVLAKQLAEDKNVVAINLFLDKTESMLVARGRNAGEMLGDYQNTLVHYCSMLDDFFKSGVCRKETHLEYLSLFDAVAMTEVVADSGAKSKPFASIAALFAAFKEELAVVDSEEYDKVIAEVRKTADSRINYFKALRQSLAIGRVSYPSDVAWFHRRNEGLVKHYLREHTNEPLSLPESDEVKIGCDFKEYKERAVRKIIEVIKKGTSMSTPAFFPVEDIVKCDAKNYFFKLEEQLGAVVNNPHILTNRQFHQELTSLKRCFAASAQALEPSSAIPEARATAGVKLIQSITTDLIAAFDNVLLDLTTEDLRHHVMINPPSM